MKMNYSQFRDNLRSRLKDYRIDLITAELYRKDNVGPGWQVVANHPRFGIEVLQADFRDGDELFSYAIFENLVSRISLHYERRNRNSKKINIE